MTRLTYMVFIVCIILVIAAVGTIVGITVGLEQAYTAGLTAALVLVTAFYAYLNSEILKTSKQSVEVANKQAEASRRMAEETRESRADSLRPIIVLGRQPIQSGIQE